MSEKGENLVPEGLRFLRHNILTKDNILGASHKARWAKKFNIPQQEEIIFFAGCGYQFLDEGEATLPMVLAMDKAELPWEKTLEVTKAFNRVGINLSEVCSKLTFHSNFSGEPLRCAFTVLQKMKVKLGFLFEEEPCCAGPLFYGGFQKEFAARAGVTHCLLKSKGVKGLITMVPSCTYILKKLFPAFVKGWEIEVRHFVEVVRKGIREGMRFRLPQKIKVTYHDPCVMSRLLYMTEEPREILRNIDGVEFVEVERCKGEWSTCCGGGGGFEVVFPEVSHILARNRVKELLETEASVIVTTCPGCILQLRAGVKELKAQGVEVMDMAQLLCRALPEE